MLVVSTEVLMFINDYDDAELAWRTQSWDIPSDTPRAILVAAVLVVDEEEAEEDRRQWEKECLQIVCDHDDMVEAIRADEERRRIERSG